MLARRERLAVALGVWAGATAMPVVSLAAVEWAGTPLWPTAVAALVGTAALGTVLAWLGVGRITDPADWFRDGLPAGALIGVPGVEVVAAIAVPVGAAVPTALAVGAGGVAGALAGFGVMFLADAAVVRRKRAATDHAVTFTARKAPEPRWKRAVAAFVVVVGGAAAALALAREPLFAVVPGLLAVSRLPTLLGGRLRRRYELLEGGIVSRLGHLPWDLFDAFELTDDELVLHGNTWPFKRLAFARESVDDEDAVVAALERVLPRASPGGDAGDDDSSAGGLRRLLKSS